MRAAVNPIRLQSQSQCAFCKSRHNGLCQGVDAQDSDGLTALEAAHSPVRIFDAGDAIYSQGDAAEYVFNLISGWVAVHRDLADGRRQITHFVLPGGMFGSVPAGRDLNHGATAITNATICPIGRVKFDELRRRVPSLNEQFIWMLEQDRYRAFETLTTIGQGSAKERIGQLLNDLAVTAAGETAIRTGVAIRIPLTQRHLAEATGLTPIHVNRVLRQLREAAVVEFHNGMLAVIDARKLQAIAEPSADSNCVADRQWDRPFAQL